MPKPEAPSVETLAADLEKVNADLKIAKSYGELNDSEKAHYTALDEVAQGDFLGMTTTERNAELSKSEGANPVEYTATDGSVFRNNDDPRLIAMAKRADENEKIAKEEREKSHNLEIAKRVKEEVPDVPGDEKVKTAVYKAFDAIKDDEIRKGAFEMLKAHNETIKLSLVKLG